MLVLHSPPSFWDSVPNFTLEALHVIMQGIVTGCFKTEIDYKSLSMHSCIMFVLFSFAIVFVTRHLQNPNIPFPCLIVMLLRVSSLTGVMKHWPSFREVPKQTTLLNTQIQNFNG